MWITGTNTTGHITLDFKTSMSKTLAQAILAALSDQATTRHAAASSSKPPLYDTPRITTIVKTLICEERQGDALAFVQTLLDDLHLDIYHKHLKEHLFIVYAALCGKTKEEIEHLLDTVTLRTVLALYTSLTVISLDMDDKGNLDIGFRLGVDFSNLPLAAKGYHDSMTTLGQGWPNHLDEWLMPVGH